MIYIGTIGTIVLLIQHEYFIPTDLNVMWKPEEEDVEDQLRAEQTKRKFDDTRNHERSVETDRFSAIFFFTVFHVFDFIQDNYLALQFISMQLNSFIKTLIESLSSKRLPILLI